MKTLTQVVLPIAAIVGLVFGITYIANYSSNDPTKKGEQTKTAAPAEALKFPLITVRTDPSDWRLRYWNSDLEVGAKGEFDYWLRNINDQPVRFAFTAASCTCAGASVGIVPQDAMSNYLVSKALTQWPGMPGGPILDTLAVLGLKDRIEWKEIAKEGLKDEVSIPGAPVANDDKLRAVHINPANPQFAIVRLRWEAKAQEGAQQDTPVRISADFVSQLPNASGSAVHLEALYSVVQPLQFYLPGGKPNEIRLNDVVAGAAITREIICWSKTRSDLPLSFELLPAGNYKDCITWTEPKRLTAEENAVLASKIQTPEQPPISVRSAYRLFLTVYERREIEKEGKKELRQLDLGPLSFQFQASAATKPISLLVHGIVRGDVRIISSIGEATDGVDFGTSFSSNETKTKRVSIVSDRSGLDLTLIRPECVPDFLEIELISDGEKDGSKHWILQVTIPPKMLYGDLPNSSKIVLQTKDPVPRRIRVPVRAKTLN